MDEQEAKNAVEMIGPIAITYLVRWNAGNDSPLRRLLERCANGAPSAAARKLFVRLGGRNAETRHRLANAGFKILGTNAISVLPDITAQFVRANKSPAINFTAYSLAQLGMPGIESLSNTITADAVHRRAALDALNRLAQYTRDKTIFDAATNAVNSINIAMAQSPPKGR